MAENAPSSDVQFLESKIDEHLVAVRKELIANSYVEPDDQGLRRAHLCMTGGKLVAVTSDMLHITAAMPGSTVTEIVTDEDFNIVSVEEKPSAPDDTPKADPLTT